MTIYHTPPSSDAVPAKDFSLGIPGWQFSDLHKVERLKDLHAEFWKYVEQVSPETVRNFQALGPETPKPKEGEVLVETGRHLGDFLARLFQVQGQTAKIKQATEALAPIYRLKREFLNIRVFRRFGEPACDEATFLDLDQKVQRLISHAPPPPKADPELAFAEVVTALNDVEKKLKTPPLSPTDELQVQNLCAHFSGGSAQEKVETALKTVEEWCVQVWVAPERRGRIAGWASFVRPNKLDFDHLVPVDRPDPMLPEKMYGPHVHARDGFKLTDPRMNLKQVLREVDYCILCHQREKDSCSHGFPEKEGGYKKNPLGIPLKGCPLDEKISEMHMLKKSGDVIGALAMVIVDNPMCPGTGHRICNDCMKGCIFQKQDPVNIPQNETAVLTDVLNLPYGFEIYSLLTRFNPLNRRRPYALPYNGKKVLVVGLGPAGYTLAHYLANEGFGVVGIDGLKIEPLDPALTGVGRPFPRALVDFGEMKKDLDERILVGFGGVSEYGITVRWDKNFLSVIYLNLIRRPTVRVYGGTRFGGTLNLDDAWGLGFDHVAIATGAGRPTIIPIKNNLIKGIRKASDFLMALQLTGAFKKSSLANLQVRLPAIVIGGGLTGIDTTTELFAYYPVQVEKVLGSFEKLAKDLGEEKVWGLCDEEEKGILETFLEHGRAVREERKLAEKERRKPKFADLVRKWGGVTLVYRKRLNDSPAYRLNHEEVTLALEEGIGIAENLIPLEAVPDKYGAVEAMRFQRPEGEVVTLPARTVCVAAGTAPNTIYEREFTGTFKLDSRLSYFQKYVAEAQADGTFRPREAKPGEAGAFFLSYEKEGKLVSFYGDNHPDYAGNVVKAMASAKHGILAVARVFETAIRAAEKQGAPTEDFEKLAAYLDEALVPRVVKVERLTPTIVDVIVKAKFAAHKFEPGQFYRLQNYETLSPVVNGNRLAMEGLALTGAWVDKEKDLLSLIVLEMGASSRLCSILKPGEPLVVMGPTGTPSEIAPNETVVLVGGGLGNAVHLSIGRAFKNAGSRVLYFAGYRKHEDVFKQDLLEEITDQIVWSVDRGEPLKPRRPQDLTFVGNIVQSMLAYAKGELGKQMYPLSEADRLLVIGSDRMMQAVTQARHGILQPFLKPGHLAFGSINSPMQCMMKEICAQCLQRHVDPTTGKETFVFSCYNQDQKLDDVDWKNLDQRLRMNSLQEKLSNRLLDTLNVGARMEQA